MTVEKEKEGVVDPTEYSYYVEEGDEEVLS